MAQHVLSIEAPDTMNKCVLRLVDTSVYNPDKDPDCLLLQITLPGFKRPVEIKEPTIEPGFMVNLTACDLEVQTTNCGTTYANLPDGVYIIKYSVAPNQYVYAEYNHLRVTCALNKIQSIYCDLDIGACDPPVEIKSKLNQVRLAQQYLNAAKAMVEFCHNPDKGMKLYNYALKLINKIDCSGSCSTC